MDLDRLIAGLPLRRLAGPPTVRICDLTEDSRTVLPGSLFIARRGGKSDGRAFIGSALQAGAVAILVDDATRPAPDAGSAALLAAPDVALATAHLAERFYGDPTSRLALAGVTGTNGKTTITFLVHQLLNAASIRCGLVGTVCIDDGVETAAASLTTPPSLELSRTFARMLESGCRAAVIEASSHALHQHRTAALRFRVGVFTNLTHDHLDYHGTMEAYAAAKALLFQSLPPAAEGGVAIVNADDPWSARMLESCRAAVVRCSLADSSARHSADPAADWSARIVARSARHTALDLSFPGASEPLRVRLPLVGDHNVMNALQAAACAAAMGLEPALAAAGLAAVVAPPGRLEPVTGPDDPLSVYVDYAHTDDALQRVLQVLRAALTDASAPDAFPPGASAPGAAPADRAPALHLVFGCGGDRDRTKRPTMGRAAALLADTVLVTSDNPRTEDPRAIADQILAGVPGELHHKVRTELDREAAIAAAVAAAREGDVVLIAGKGHEDYQILPDGAGGTVTRHFDDREVARAALRARGIEAEPPRVILRAGRRPRPAAAQPAPRVLHPADAAHRRSEPT